MPIKDGSREETPDLTVRSVLRRVYIICICVPVLYFLPWTLIKSLLAVPETSNLVPWPRSQARSKHVEIARGVMSFRCRHVIWCDSDTLGFAGTIRSSI